MSTRLTTFLPWAMMLGSLAAGCSSLPAGPLDAVRANSASARRGNVYLIRGWNGLWSQGMDDLARRLTAEGVEAHAYQQGQSAALGDAIRDRYRAAADPDPLVLIGFSFGADESIRIARKLSDAGLAVDLLVTLDPVTPPDVPPGVRACRNFYQSNGVWDALPWLRGVPVRTEGRAEGRAEGRVEGEVARVANTNVRDDPDLLEPDTGHHTIAANRKLHEKIVEEVRRVCPTR